MGKDFLKEIVEHKKDEVARAKRSIPMDKIREMALCGKENRPFFENLKNAGPFGINIIAEIKRASPSKGDIRPGIDPALYAREYEAGGARAISVLTDTSFFKGSFEDLKTARQNTTLPILRKDFLVSSYQIYESLTIGADAVLLIVRILSKKQLKDYLSLCKELKLDALVEINSEEDLEVATLSEAKLIGINNRDLSSFKTDVNTAMRLKSLLGPDQVAVAASGISNKTDIEKNLAFGITSFLIGESLVRADNTREFLQALLKKDGK